MTTETIEVVIAEGGSGTDKLTAAINKLSAAADKLGSTSNKTQRELKETGDAAAQASTKMGILQRSMGGLSGAGGLLASAFGGIASAMSVGKVIEYADSYSKLQNQVKLLTGDGAALTAALEEVKGIANRTGTDIGATGELYAKMGDAFKRTGKDASELGPMVEAVNRAVQLTGPSADQAKNGLMQFNQALGNGKLSGDELTSVMENVPGLAKAIAAGFSQSGPVAVGELKNLAEQGKLTSSAIIEALERSAPAFKVLSDNAIPTVGQAMTVLSNNMTDFVGKADAATGATGLLRSGILLIANNLNIVIPVLGIFVGLLALGAIAGAIMSLASLAQGFVLLAGGIGASTLAMLTNPLILGTLAVVVAVGAAAMGLFGDKIRALLASLPGWVMGMLGVETATANVGTKVTETAAKVQTMAEKINAVSGGVQERVKPAFDIASIAMADFGNKTTTAGTATQSMGDKINAVSGGVLPKATTATTALTTEKKELTGVAKMVADAMAAITPPAAAATEELDKQQDRVKKLGAEYNQLGEKLETFEEFTRRTTDALKKKNQAIADAHNSLDGYNKATTMSVDANGKLVVSFKEVETTAKGASTGIAEVGQTARTVSVDIEGLNSAIIATVDANGRWMVSNAAIAQGLRDQANAAESAALANMANQRSLDSLRAANDSYGQSLRATIQNEAGTGRSLVNRDPEIAGTFTQRNFYPVEYDGMVIGAIHPTIPDAARIAEDATRRAGRLESGLTRGEAQTALGLGGHGFYRRVNADGSIEGGAFAHGGRILNGGTDSVPIRVSPNERVTVETPAQMRNKDRSNVGTPSQVVHGNVVNDYRPINVVIRTEDIESFKRSRTQITQDLAMRIRAAG